MTRITIVRSLLGLAGVALIGVGAVNLLGLGLVDLLWVVFWLGAGLVLHDGVLAPTTAVLGKAAADRWSGRARGAVLVGLVSVGSLTLIAIPLMIQHNSVAGNDTLLGRNYLVGWLAACTLVAVGAALAEVVSRWRISRRDRQSTATR